VIVFCHGFAATGQGSSKAASLRSFFDGRTAVVTPTYPCGDPGGTFTLLRDTVRASAKAGEPLLIGGISFGGFWARRLAAEFPGAGLLLINPALDGAATLARYAGEQLNYDTGETFFVSPEAVRDGETFAVAGDRPDLPILALLAADDDVVPPGPALDAFGDRGNVRVILLDRAGHRFSRFDEVLGEIGRFYDRLPAWPA
jgi:predicted esterase YcpF (UPF0227 family)